MHSVVVHRGIRGVKPSDGIDLEGFGGKGSLGKRDLWRCPGLPRRSFLILSHDKSLAYSTGATFEKASAGWIQRIMKQEDKRCIEFKLAPSTGGQ